MPTYICRDCGHESDYDEMYQHIRGSHGREMTCGREPRAGDVIRHNGIPCKILKLNQDGSALVQPQISITAEYRIADQRWAAEVEP